MLLKQINLRNFRNFNESAFIFNPFLTIIIGENTRGKTNLLEAVYFIINGSGFRELKEEELIQFNKNNATVEAKFGLQDQVFVFKINLSKKDLLVEKTFYLDKAKKKYYQFISAQTKAILFSPEQIEIITGSPDLRRDYFNKIISFYDFNYKKKLSNYENALRKRNKILEVTKDIRELKDELLFWDQYLEDNANYITKIRAEYISFLNKNNNIDKTEFSIDYLKSELTKKKLEASFAEEQRYRRTLIGPQKDDFVISKKENGLNKNVHHFGSRGEQRLAIIWLKLNEIKFYEDKYNKRPILLLDDVFSEFDLKNKKLILDLIKNYQTIATTTEIELLDLSDMPKTIIKL